MPQGNPPQGQWQGQPSSGRQVYTQYPQPPYPQPGKDTMPPLKPRKKPWRRNLVILGVIVLILLATVGTYSRYKAITSTNTATATHSTTHRPTPTPKHPTATSTPSTVTPTVTYLTFDNGTYQIGNDSQPAAKIIKFGTYRTRKASPKCQYTRFDKHGTSIASNPTDAPAIITIDKTDTKFQSQNCDIWTSNLSPITTSKTSFGDGMYFVGKDKDILPGTYTNAGKSGCSYARLSGFGGTKDDIIPPGPTDTTTTVTILLADTGFQSNGCGTWTKQ